MRFTILLITFFSVGSSLALGAREPRRSRKKYIVQYSLGESFYDARFFERRVPDPAHCYLAGFVTNGNIMGEDAYGRFPIAFLNATNRREGNYVYDKTIQELRRLEYCR